MKIMINKLPYRASVVIIEKVMMNIIIPGHPSINDVTYTCILFIMKTSTND